MHNASRNPSDLRIATYNVEWFSALFGRDDELLLDDHRSARHKISRREQAEALATVIKRIDADVIMIIEAPNTDANHSTTRALQNFAAHFGLRQDTAVTGFESHTDQEIAALYDPVVVALAHDPKGAVSDGKRVAHAPRFDGVFKLDVDVDGQPDQHRFSKPPLELALRHRATQKTLRLIGVHAKSKAAHGIKDEAEAIKVSIDNRRKQLAQCIWIRERVEDHLQAQEPVIVLGDFNDGPGLDAYEKLFGKSGVEVVLGDAAQPEMQLADPHAQIWLDPRQGWALSSARFYHAGLRWFVNTLLDYVMLSPDLVSSARPEWHILHPFDDPACFNDKRLQHALLTASDHFPVTVDLHF